MKSLNGGLCLIMVLFICMTGCTTQNSNPIAPAESGKSSGIDNHSLWGLWQFTADPNARTLDVIPLRNSSFHLNTLPFLEPPALVNLTLESLKFTGNVIDADIGLRHPFLGLTEFTGFDVCGILITNGSVTGFTDAALRMAGTGDTRLLNPDGYSRWWNPAEFPHGSTISTYKDGLLGTPDSVADYNSTLNAYKYFCDDLKPTDSLDKVTLAKRGLFSAGQKNIRHYTIDMGTGLVFNYAVDACWKFPNGQKPWSVPGDFPPDANRPEAWRIKVTELENTLWNDGVNNGGNLVLQVDVYDWFNAGLNTVKAESPGNFAPVASASPTGGGAGFSTYQLDILNATPAAGSIDMLIYVECEVVGYQELLPGKNVTAYFKKTAQVSSLSFAITSPNGGEVWAGLSYKDIKWVAPPGILAIDLYYSTDDFVSDINEIKTDVPNTGIYSWYVPNIESDTVKVRMIESGGGLEDESDDFFKITKGLCNFGNSSFVINKTYFGLGYPNYIGAGGLKLSKQSLPECLLFNGYHDSTYQTIYAMKTSDPNAGTIAQFDTANSFGMGIGSFVVDSYSIPGIDRLIFMSGSGIANELKAVDWNGTAFVNPQTLPKPDTYGTWGCCVKPNGDLYLFNAYAYGPKFYYYNKAAGYAKTEIFTLLPSTFDFGNTSNFKGIVYNPVIDALVLFCRNSSISNGGQLCVIDLKGNLIFKDMDIFGTSTLICNLGGMYIDMNNPDCRILVYVATDDGTIYFARYSAEFDEKKVVSIPGPGVGHGICRGDINKDGTLWAVWDYHNVWYHYVFKLNPPSDW